MDRPCLDSVSISGGATNFCTLFLPRLLPLDFGVVVRILLFVLRRLLMLAPLLETTLLFPLCRPRDTGVRKAEEEAEREEEEEGGLLHGFTPIIMQVVRSAPMLTRRPSLAKAYSASSLVENIKSMEFFKPGR